MKDKKNSRQFSIYCLQINTKYMAKNTVEVIKKYRVNVMLVILGGTAPRVD